MKYSKQDLVRIYNNVFSEQILESEISEESLRLFNRPMNDNSRLVLTNPIDLDINLHTAFSEAKFNGEINEDIIYPLQYVGCDKYKGCFAVLINPEKYNNEK